MSWYSDNEPFDERDDEHCKNCTQGGTFCQYCPATNKEEREKLNEL